MNNKHVLVYGVLESTNDLINIYVGHIHFKKLRKFQTLLHDQAQEQQIRFLLIIFIDKNHCKKGKYGTM